MQESENDNQLTAAQQEVIKKRKAIQDKRKKEERIRKAKSFFNGIKNKILSIFSTAMFILALAAVLNLACVAVTVHSLYLLYLAAISADFAVAGMLIIFIVSVNAYLFYFNKQLRIEFTPQ